MKPPSPPLSNQLELLKLYATDLSDEDLQELKDQLAQFYACQSVQKANEAWKEKGLTQEDIDRWIHTDRYMRDKKRVLPKKPELLRSGSV